MRKLLSTTAAVLMLSAGGVALAAPQGGGMDGMRAQHKAHFEEALKKLPEDKAALVRKTFEEMRAERKGNWEGHKAEREEMEKLLTAPQFDKAAFVAKAKELAEQSVSMRVHGVERMADLAAQLNQDERKVLAELMPKKGMHGKHGEPGDFRRPPPPPPGGHEGPEDE